MRHLKKKPAKNKCWVQFSKFIRLRDCLKTTGSLTHGACCSCGKVLPLGKLQAGHFMPGRSDSVLLDEQTVHAQCYFCNCERQGNWPGYYKFMVDMHGQDVVNDLVAAYLRGSDKHYTPEQLQVKERYYEDKVNRLLARGVKNV